MTGGTFIISKGGVSGSFYGTSNIKMPQKAVLDLHGVKEGSVTVDGQIVNRPMICLCIIFLFLFLVFVCLFWNSVTLPINHQKICWFILFIFYENI